MSTLILDHSKTECSETFHISCGNKEAFVSVKGWGIDVCCMNASAKAWGRRGTGGKTFESFEAAIAGYKSSEMKAIIECVKDLAETRLSVVA